MTNSRNAVAPTFTVQLADALKECPLIAVLRWIPPSEVESIVETLIEAGFRLIEVPLNSPEPFVSIERAARRFGSHALIGAGTVMSPEQVGRVGDAGGQIIVMPHADVAVIRAAKQQGLACFPGVATPTEGFAALGAGADGLKVFPAEAISPAVLKAWRAVFAMDIPLLPTGGISPQSMQAWVDAGASGFGTGGGLYAPGRSVAEVRERADALVAAWRATQVRLRRRSGTGKGDEPHDFWRPPLRRVGGYTRERPCNMPTRKTVYFDQLPAGSIPALVTPMLQDGAIDWKNYRGLIDWHVEAGTNGIVVMGSTGESATVSMEEHSELIRVAVEHSGGRIPIIAGTGANSTAEAIELTGYARKWGATAALSVVPYYNKPTQEGMYQHFKAIAEAVDIPVILYNVPGRTVADMSNETVLRLSDIPNIVGLKDATGDIGRGILLMRSLPDDFAVYSGDDPTAAALILLGARGNISVTANVIPDLMAMLCKAALVGDLDIVNRLSRRIAPLHQAMFIEANPIPVKWALAERGRIEANHRLPMVPLRLQTKVVLARRCATPWRRHRPLKGATRLPGEAGCMARIGRRGARSVERLIRSPTKVRQ
ncbi:MAG: 4-hydroxy-tetrahydrodipicolinate synthase [Rhizobium sp.]|nr:4-hydroxy-tetrahydrodipicolinate synthase [Rhizobium sp.]